VIYEKIVAARQAKAKDIGKKPRGRGPKLPIPGAHKKDQVDLTDEESRIMPSSDKGFVQANNGQAAVDVETEWRRTLRCIARYARKLLTSSEEIAETSPVFLSAQ